MSSVNANLNWAKSYATTTGYQSTALSGKLDLIRLKYVLQWWLDGTMIPRRDLFLPVQDSSTIGCLKHQLTKHHPSLEVDLLQKVVSL